MKILILGAGGRLGQHIVADLLDRGHQVRAFVHRNNPLSAHVNLELFQGDIHDGAAIVEAVSGIDAVASALGSAEAPVKDISSSAMHHLVPAMDSRGIARIVSSTGSAACTDAERTSPHPHLRARIDQMMRFNPELVLDGEEHMRLLTVSGLDWTVVRAPPMRGESGVAYALSLTPPSPGTVSSYRAVATAMVDLVLSQNWSKVAPFVW
jgi:putative NADH-flavin reductase